MASPVYDECEILTVNLFISLRFVEVVQVITGFVFIIFKYLSTSILNAHFVLV